MLSHKTLLAVVGRQGSQRPIREAILAGGLFSWGAVGASLLIVEGGPDHRQGRLRDLQEGGIAQ